MLRLKTSTIAVIWFLLIIVSATFTCADDEQPATTAFSLKFNNPNAFAKSVPPAQIQAETHFFKDNQSGDTFSAICAYSEIYPKIDLVCFGDSFSMEHVYIVHPGGDPSQILFGFDNVNDVSVNNTGNVTYKHDDLQITQSQPVVFDKKLNSREKIEGGRNTLAFEGTVGISPGPDFDNQVSNEEYLQFLNDTEAHKTSGRAANMFFDKNGNVWMSSGPRNNNELLFKIETSLLNYDSRKPEGERYSCPYASGDSDYYQLRPVAGVTWYGAVKYSNWLTIVSGQGASARRYKEGSSPSEWSKPPQDEWNTHFFSIAPPENGDGYAIDTAYSAASTLEIHILMTFYSTSVQDRAPPSLEDKTGDSSGFMDTANDFVQPEGFVSDQEVKVSSPSTSAQDDKKDEKDKKDKSDRGKKDKPPRGGILYKTKPMADDDDDDDQGGGSTGGGGGTGSGGGGGAAVIPTDFFVTINDQNSALGALITVSEPDINSNTVGTTSFVRIYDRTTNTLVTFTAPATEPGGNPFNRWQKNGVDIGITPAINVLVDSSMTLTAIYDQLRTLNVLSANPNNNVDITLVPLDYNGDGAVVTGVDFNRTYIDGTTVTLTAEPTAPNGFRFLEWQSSLGTTYSTPAVNITINQDLLMTAIYAEPFDVTIQSQNLAANVTIAVSPDDINSDGNVLTGVGDFVRTYIDGTGITLTAPDDIGGTAYFERWRQGAATFFASHTINLTVSSDMTLTAEYLPPRTITIQSTNPNNGVNVTATTDLNSSGNLVTVPAGVTRSYRNGTSVTLEADLTGSGGTTFRRWVSSLGPTYLTRQITVTANADETLTAEYVAPWDLTIASQNPNVGVDITVSPADINSDSDLTTAAGGTIRIYNNNDSVTLTAEQDAPGGNRFRYWQSSLGGFTYTRDVTVSITTNITMTARYDPLRALTINSTDPGQGVAMTVSPNDVQGNGNGNTLFVRYFADGEVVTVTADNVADGQTFSKWQVNGVDYDTAITTTITMDADYNLTAIYAYVPGPIPDPDPSPGGL